MKLRVETVRTRTMELDAEKRQRDQVIKEAEALKIYIAELEAQATKVLSSILCANVQFLKLFCFYRRPLPSAPPPRSNAPPPPPPRSEHLFSSAREGPSQRLLILSLFMLQR
jgi:hypothetical protein